MKTLRRLFLGPAVRYPAKLAKSPPAAWLTASALVVAKPASGRELELASQLSINFVGFVPFRKACKSLYLLLRACAVLTCKAGALTS